MQALRETTNTVGEAGDACSTKPEYPHTLLHLRQHAQRFTVDDFDINKKPLGSGMFGKVYKARHRATKRQVVLKVIEKASIIDENLKPQLQREIEVHCRLIHPNLIRMYAYFQDEERAYVVLELANKGTLYQKLQDAKDKILSEREAAEYTKQLCKALEFCHSRNVIHRDIKPENLLLMSNPHGEFDTIKLADFGYAVAQRLESRRTTMCGTVEYLPPEVVGGEQYGFSFDMWTVGVLLFEMLAGCSPFFDDRGQDAIMDRIREGRLPPASPHVNLRRMRSMRGAWDLINKLLVWDPTARLSAGEVLRHRWVVEHTGPYEPQQGVVEWVSYHGPSLADAPLLAGQGGAGR